MKPLETVDSTVAPSGAPVTLLRRGSDLFIHLGGEELMSTRTFESEEALAELALRQLVDARCPRVLIGGLGLGYTLRSALALLPPHAEVTVVELLPAIIEWNREYVPTSRTALSDPRVRVLAQDVNAVLARTARSSYNAILLDVDDGPSSVCFESNLGLYGRQGLAHLKECLTTDGILAVWSAQSDPWFAKVMRKSGFDVRVETARGHRRKGARYSIFLGRVSGSCRKRRR